MGDQHERSATASASASADGEPNQPTTRTRWTPKPEQVMILESIFNGGLVNPPKEETVRIRKLLEPFGPVGDTNIFYWFQNRRSRSRRRRKQIIQAAAAEQLQDRPIYCGGGIQGFGNTVFPGGFPEAPPLPNYHLEFDPYPLCLAGSCSSSAPPPPYGAGEIHDGSTSGDHLFGFQQFDESSNFCYGEASDFHHQSGYCPEMITVFINGVATEVGRGVPVDVATMFDVDNCVLVNGHGFLVQSFDQHGESYFLVPRES